MTTFNDEELYIVCLDDEEEELDTVPLDVSVQDLYQSLYHATKGLHSSNIKLFFDKIRVLFDHDHFSNGIIDSEDCKICSLRHFYEKEFLVFTNDCKCDLVSFRNHCFAQNETVIHIPDDGICIVSL